MRVIAGEAKGRRLFGVRGESTRPITDRVKASLFNILAPDVPGSRFLDLFAGTGGVGIEALSRGAEEATFVERDERALTALRRNLQVTGLAGRARVLRRDAFKFIASYGAQPFDIIYVAPPQYQGLWARTLSALDGSPLLASDGLVVTQIHPKEHKALALTQLALSDQRRYGSTMLCFYRVRARAVDSPSSSGPAHG